MIYYKKSLEFAESIVSNLLKNPKLDYTNIKKPNLGVAACFLRLFINNVEVATLGSLFPEKLEELILKASKAVVEKALASGVYSSDIYGSRSLDYNNRFYIELIMLDKPIEIGKSVVKSIDPKNNCIIVSMSNKLGFVLPTTSMEYGFDSLDALEVACHKAGLGFNAWMLDNVKIYISKAIIQSSRIR